MRNYATIAKQYAEDVIARRVLAGRWVLAAAARFLADLDRAAAGWDFYFDAEDAAHLCAFTESLPHIKGDLAKRSARLRLEPWQVFILANLNGWRRVVGGGRRFRTAYIEVPRKNGKSTMIAPPLLFLLTADGEAGPEVYTAATKMAQSRIVFDVARAMAQKTPELRARAGLIVQQHKIIAPNTTGEMRPLEAKKLDGLNPHGVGVDELHEHRDRVVWDALADALGARSNPLMIAITTAGEDLDHVCYEQHDYLSKVLTGVFTDESYFGVIYAIDADDDPLDPSAWGKANPNLGVSKQHDYMEDRASQARTTPAQMGEFLRKHCGRWTRMGATAIDIEGWKKGAKPPRRREDYRSAGGVLGLDLALRDDLAAIAYVHEDPDDGLTVFCDHFVTEDSVNQPGRDALKAWADQGLVEVHRGAMIDLERVQEKAMKRADYHGVSEVAIDPYLGGQMAMNLEREGVPVVEMRQTPMNLSMPFDRVAALITDGKVRHDGDPVLAWMVSNVIEIRRGDFKVADKRKPSEKIDGFSAIQTAVARLGAEEVAPASPWEDPEFSMRAEQ